MPRPNQSDEKRKELLPIVAQTFAELGYRRATTAELASRCDVRENILYRLWADKKGMFVASIDYVFEQAAQTWQKLLGESNDTTGSATRILEYEAQHYGESRLQRIIFAGLSETDEPEIRDALRKMYVRFHRFVKDQVTSHRSNRRRQTVPDDTVSAWAIVALGNMANISRELGLLSDRGRKKMFAEAGHLLLNGQTR